MKYYIGHMHFFKKWESNFDQIDIQNPGLLIKSMRNLNNQST